MFEQKNLKTFIIAEIIYKSFPRKSFWHTSNDFDSKNSIRESRAWFQRVKASFMSSLIKLKFHRKTLDWQFVWYFAYFFVLEDCEAKSYKSHDEAPPEESSQYD